MNKKICVVTWYTSLNYGTCLQCYALQKYLSDLGYVCYTPDSLKYYYGYKHPFETWRVFKRKVFSHKRRYNKLKEKQQIMHLYKNRIWKNSKFVEKNDNIFHVRSKKDFLRLVSDTDIFITGSDQIWNPEFVSPVYLLAFVPNNKLKIAYASSIGVDQIPEKVKGFYVRYLSRFKAIGVRERTAMDELVKLNLSNVRTVLDPTFLLDKVSWEAIAEKPSIDYSRPFIFCYFIGNKNFLWVDIIKKINKGKKYNIYTALSENYTMCDIGVCLPDLGVAEFLWMLSHASYVFTDSFHAVALSINFNTDFYAFYRFAENDACSQNSRIMDVLMEFGITNRLIENSIQYLSGIDYDCVNSILKEKRRESLSFIQNAFDS